MPCGLHDRLCHAFLVYDLHFGERNDILPYNKTGGSQVHEAGNIKLLSYIVQH